MARTPLTKNKIEAMVGRGHTFIKLADIRVDGGTQPRDRIDEETIVEYSERMTKRRDGMVVDPENAPFEPLILTYDGSTYWLTDGFHRYHAAKRAGINEFQAEVNQGTRRDAFVTSLGVNAKHGKRRTSKDKHRVVLLALKDGELKQLSDSEIARICRVTQPYVSKVRNSLIQSGDYVAPEHVVGADGRKYKTSVGKRIEAAAVTPPKIRRSGQVVESKVENEEVEGDAVEVSEATNPAIDLELRRGDFREALLSETPQSFDFVFTQGSQNPQKLELWSELASHANRLLRAEGIFLAFVDPKMLHHVLTIVTRKKFAVSHLMGIRWIGAEAKPAWSTLVAFTRDGRELGLPEFEEVSPDFGGRNHIARHVLQRLGGKDAALIDPMAGKFQAPIVVAAGREGCRTLAVESDPKALREAKIMADRVLGVGL